MIKSYLYAGLAILAISIVIFFLASQYVTVGSPTVEVNVTALAGAIAQVPIHLNYTAIAVVGVVANSATNIYVLNQSTYSGLVSYLNANDMRSGYSYVRESGVGANDTFLNTTTAFTSIYQASANLSGNYTDYIVIDNSGVSNSVNGTVTAGVIYKSYNYSSSVGASYVLLVPVFGIILGLAVIVYSFFKKPAEEEEQEAEAPKKRAKKGGS